MTTRVFLIFYLLLLVATTTQARSIVDGAGRTVTIPDTVNQVICSGAGCVRLLSYLQSQNTLVGVDDLETRKRQRDPRPYAIANPQFKALPVFGEFRGHDHPEQILTLENQPQVIFKTFSQMGHDPIELQQKTGIPVVVLQYGNLTQLRPEFYTSLRTMATVLGKEQRAEQVITFIEQTITDIQHRTTNIDMRPSVYLGGVAFKGPHGFQSTEPTYPPFAFLDAQNCAAVKIAGEHELSNSNVAKEKIVSWNPNYLFLDLSTIRLGEDAGGLYELRHDPAYRTLSAVQSGKVFGLLPYNMYAANHGSTLANSYYIGKTLYPDRFTDINPTEKADEIYEFLVGKPVFNAMNTMCGNMAFSSVPVQ
ncbi:iron ABC transporter substrate-binding protein [Desulfosediminicola flagellatus]|uniref:iron ABC transporter substrate-binding protein n=1 Tax=Desulfosediminicola flagellatus TaxID=2569541 RepID=UPI0010ABCCC7|nr:iron ABC transporter substrate-binding protein [Desulfosediminicola flagellatus]